VGGVRSSSLKSCVWGGRGIHSKSVIELQAAALVGTEDNRRKKMVVSASSVVAPCESEGRVWWRTWVCSSNGWLK
jgi:hypothetical protein